jgi:hypothetical protein
MRRLRKQREEEDDSTSLRWPVGAFYIPGFSSDRRIAPVPGAADTHRRFFLVRAAELEPDLLPTLRAINESANAIKAWATRWHLTDRWCVLLAEDTKRWWSNNPGAGGWLGEIAGDHDIPSERGCRRIYHPGSGTHCPQASSSCLSTMTNDTSPIAILTASFGTRGMTVRIRIGSDN